MTPSGEAATIVFYIPFVPAEAGIQFLWRVLGPGFPLSRE